MAIVDDFWAHVKVGSPDECWPWLRARMASGYGMFHLSGGKVVYAHRHAYELVRGAIPDGLFVCHSCDNRQCTNTSHLWLGTAADNSHDMARKDRASRTVKHSKITKADVAIIRARRASGELLKTIAIDYNITETQISRIARKLHWPGEQE